MYILFFVRISIGVLNSETRVFFVVWIFILDWFD